MLHTLKMVIDITMIILIVVSVTVLVGSIKLMSSNRRRKRKLVAKFYTNRTVSGIVNVLDAQYRDERTAAMITAATIIGEIIYFVCSFNGKLWGV